MAVRIESHAEPIPGYRLLERLGGGGFGEVWKAEAPGGLLKAIKFVFGDLQTAGEDGVRAEQELKALSRVKTVRHPYVLSLERYDIVDGQLVIVMELADRNLWDRYKECRCQGLPGIPRDELLDYMEEAAEALDLMNIEYQLQHLDIKPQNLFLVHNHVKVADFGLVKDLEGMVASVTGGVTPVYAAPETFDGWVSRFSDQYSLAIVYQELLTGHRPFAGTNVRQLVVQHLQGTPDLSSLSQADRPPIARALSKKPDDRFPNCRVLVQALRGGKRPPSRNGHAGGAVAGPIETEIKDPAGLGIPDSDFQTPEPDLATPEPSPASDSKATYWIGSLGDVIAQPTPQTPLSRPLPAVEVTGDGVLFPAVIVGLGRVGLGVLQRLRENMHEAFGSFGALPNIRLLYIDTDPDVLRAAVRGETGAALTASEILLARLNRPSHYLRPRRDGQVSIDSWFERKMVYRIPRTLVTTGMRALGRLAFCDNYPSIAHRLRADLDACTRSETLTKATRNTRLGLRSNRPRVYVVSSLAGGTGSGMFLDLAYLARSLLKEMGYEQPETVGLFFLPPVDRKSSRNLALGNAYTALTELNHFSTPGVTFTARYDEKGKVVEDAEPPFSRCFMLPMPQEKGAATAQALSELGAEFLKRDLTTFLGRTADQSRLAMSSRPEAFTGMRFHTFGLYRICCPRRALIQRTARRLCLRLVQQWMAKDSAPVREAVRTWVQEETEKRQLNSQLLIERLREACERTLQRAPEAAFTTATDALAQTGAHFDPAVAYSALEELDQLLGRPNENQTDRPQAVIPTALRNAADGLVIEWGQQFAELAVHLIEQPAFRLAGAEEAIRQVVAGMEQVLQHHEPLAKELGARAADSLARIHAILAALRKDPPTGRRLTALLSELTELIRSYPKWRYQHLVLQHLAITYVSLRGQLSDQLREVSFCRVRLHELAKAFDEGSEEPEGEKAAGPSRFLFPNGCKTLADAVEDVLKNISAEEVLALDTRIQAMIRHQFKALVHICLYSANFLKTLTPAMLHEAESFAGSRFTGVGVTELFFEQYADESAALHELGRLGEDAEPELASRRTLKPPQIHVLATPAGPASDRFFGLARKTWQDIEMTAVNNSDDILLYREASFLPLSDLEQLGTRGQEAYQRMNAIEHYTPHSRLDVQDWRIVSPD